MMAKDNLPRVTLDSATTPTGLLRWLQSPWLAFFLGCLAFTNSLPNDMVYDDEPRVLRNARIRSLTNFSHIWLSDTLEPDSEEQARMQPNRDLLYRPLTTYTFAINYALHGMAPAGFRAFNVLLHGLVCLLVWHFIQRLFGDSAFSSCTALLFAVHPLHCEAVVYIVGRAEVLVAAFILLGLLVLLPRQGLPGAKRAALAAPLFFLALFAKESGFCYIPVALIVLHAIHRRSTPVPRRWWLMHVGYLLLPFVIYLPLRYVSLDYHFSRSTPFSLLNPLCNTDLPERIMGIFTILGHYTRLFLWPIRMSVDYGMAVIDPKTGPEPMTWLGVIAAIGLLIGLLGYFRGGTTWRRVAVLCAIWHVSYFVISNIFVLICTAVGESRMYWPSVVIFMLMAMAGLGLWRKVGTILRLGPRLHLIIGCMLMALILAAFGTRTVLRNNDWATSLRLFTKDAATYPRSAQLNANAAIDYCNRALNSEDQAQQRWDLERADTYYARALEVFPKHWGFLSHRAQIQFWLGNLGGAITNARQALELNPRDHVLNDALGRYLAASGQYPEAAKYLEEALRLVPGNQVYAGRLAEFLLSAGQPGRAIPILEHLIARQPGNAKGRAILAKLLMQHNPQAARRYASEAAYLTPDNVDYQLLLAEATVAVGRHQEGLESYRRIWSSLPEDHPLRTSLERRIRELKETNPDSAGP